MENWQKELATWAPNLKVLNYYGAQDERRHMRLQIVNEEVEYDVILTTYNMVISSADDRVLFRRQVLLFKNLFRFLILIGTREGTFILL